MKQAFVLSDCEYPDCRQKPFALLTANPTKAHHYIAQTEQRQHAHNPEVSPQNQNVYLLPPTLFRKPFQGKAKSVNIISNLVAPNLYTLTTGEQTTGEQTNLQYNLESWFNRHESGYEESCATLRSLPEGSQNIPEAVWRILRLKFLGILRNPHNYRNLFAHRLHQAIHAKLPDTSFEFVRLISQRDPEQIETIMKTYGFTFLGYINWLSNLYGMLSEGVTRPSLFEQMFRAAFDSPESVRIELYRYSDGLCLFNDRAFCLQESKQQLSIGVNIARDMFAIVHVQAGFWQQLKQSFHHKKTHKHGTFIVSDNNHIQRLAFNRLTLSQAKQAVFGHSADHRFYGELK